MDLNHCKLQLEDATCRMSSAKCNWFPFPALQYNLKYVWVCRFSCICTPFWVCHVLNHVVFGDISRDTSPIIRQGVWVCVCGICVFVEDTSIQIPHIHTRARAHTHTQLTWWWEKYLSKRHQKQYDSRHDKLRKEFQYKLHCVTLA